MLAGLLLNLGGQKDAGKRRNERRRVIVNDRLYLVNDAELEQLLTAWLPDGKVPRSVAVPQPKRRAKVGKAAERAIVIPSLPTVEQRIEYVEERFEDEFSVIDMLRRLVADQDEEDVEVIALWH